MALRSSNRRRNAWAVERLDVQPTDRVLEIGFGPGIAVRELARRATRGYVAGVDHSAVLVEQAFRRNRQAIRAGRVDLRLGAAESLPDFREPFDKILAVNSVMFWDDPVQRLRELRKLLRTGGVIAIVRQPRGPGSSTATRASVGAELTALLTAAGFAASEPVASVSALPRVDRAPSAQGADLLAAVAGGSLTRHGASEGPSRRVPARPSP
jgi:SAM-dependent methyltransferase